MALWSRFVGTAGSTSVGVALGSTAVPALLPAAQFLANEAWKLHPDKPPDALVLAEGVAQGQVDPGSAQEWANQQGISDNAFAALVQVANVGPQLGYAFEAWRRDLLSDADFNTALKRTGLEERWYPALRGLKNHLLTSPELAMAQQQGFVDAARANSEGALQGITNERQQLRFEMAGLPPGIEMGLALLRRGIIDQATFAQIVREGHTKTKYTGVLTQLQRQLLSAATAVRAHLKGHISAAEMHSRGADWGYTPADMDLWYLSEGRPATVHEIHIGYARGASVPGASGELDAIATAVKQSDIRPEYTGILEAARFSYPSPFALRGLAQAGDLGGEAAVEKVLLEIGWKPDFAQKVAQAWTAGTGATADPHLTKAQTQLWTTTHRSYVGEMIDHATATAALTSAGVAAGATSAILTLWGHERTLIRKQLTPAQIKKAYREGIFTQPQATSELLARGYDQQDATVLLEE